VTIKILVSVVRSLILSLPLWLFATSCTLRHTGDLSRQAAIDLGLRNYGQVSRSAQWRLPDHTAVCVTEPSVGRNLQSSHPRLTLALRRTLEAEMQTRFARYAITGNAQSLSGSLAEAAQQQCHLLFQFTLRQVDEKLSSITEWIDDHGFEVAESGRDRLLMMLKIFDVHSGRLLDTVGVDCRGGWRWREHRVEELVEPALAAMFDQLQARQLVLLP
jgi:hypothetical protein